MQTVYNVQTGLPEQLSTDKIQEGLKEGTHAFKKGAKVNVLDPEGKSYSMDSSEIYDAIDNGWKLETPDETEIRNYVNENKGLGGALKVAGKQFIDEALLGVPELVEDKTEDPLELAKRDALKKDHNIANTLGGLAGFGATLLPTMGASAAAKVGSKVAGAKLFEGASKLGTAVESKVASKLSQVAAPQIVKDAGAKAAGYAVEGATIAAPTAITEAVLGDPNEAAETMMAGGLFGGVLGAAIPGLKKAGQFAVNKAQYFSKFLPQEKEAAFNAIGATSAQREKLMTKAPDVVDKMPQFLRDITKDAPLDLANSEKLLSKIKNVEVTSGKAIGNTINQLDDRLKSITKGADEASIAELKPNMYNYNDLAKKLDEKYVKPYLNDNRYESQIAKVRQEIKSIDEFVKANFSGDIQPLDFKGLREFQQKSKELVNFDKKNMISDLATDARKEIVDDIQLYFKDKLAPKIKEAFPELSKLADQFKLHNDNYRMAINLSPVIGKKVNKEQASSFINMGNILAGGFGGPLGLAAKYAAEKAKGVYDVGGLLLSEQMVKKVAKSFDQIPDSLVKYQKPSGRAFKSLSIGALTGNKEDDDYDVLRGKLQAFADNPESSQYSQDLLGLAETGAPEISNNLQVKSVEAAHYLLSKIPKPLTPNNPLVKGKTYKPSDMEMAKFKRQLKTVIDPFSVIEDLNNNDLTSDQVQVLSDLYPNVLNQIRIKVMDSVEKNPSAIPYNKRLKLSLLLGMDLDPSLDSQTASIIMGNQAEIPEQEQLKPNPNANFTTYPTENQRIQNNLK